LGCGDAVLAAATLTLAAGGSLQAAALIGSIAAAVEVQEVGNVPVTVEQVLAYLQQQDEQERGTFSAAA
jgi:bifunctional ADP-heptose synthase (sugar kinase/adenylyltransferase)